MEPTHITPNGMGPAAGSLSSAGGAAGKGQPGFKEALQGYLEHVDGLQQEADKALAGLATGKMDNLHELIVAINEADLSFRLMMQIRNRLVEAYKEIMRMQL